MGFVNQVVHGIADIGDSIAPGSGKDIATAAVVVGAIMTGGAIGAAVGSAAASGLSIALADTAISGATLVSIGYGVGAVAQAYAMSAALSSISGGANSSSPTAVNQSLASGILINVTSNVAGLPVIYGTRRVGGTRVLTQVSGSNNEYLHLVFAVCEGEIDSFLNVYIDNVATSDAKFTSGAVNQAWSYVGTDTQTVEPTLVADLPSIWLSTATGGGVAYYVLKLKYDPKAFTQFPTITFDVKGKKVYDPRTSTTVYSNNPALCIRDYLTNQRYGKGIANSFIDDASFIAAANYCDVLVTVPGGSQKRYTCDGVIDINNTAFDNLKALLTSCRGLLVYSGGMYKLRLDSAAIATFAFTEDNITGNWTISQSGRRQRYNRVTAGFYDPSLNWQPNLVISDSSAYRAVDNALLLETKIELPFTANLYTAQQLAGLTLKQSRFGTIATFTALQEALRCEVGDVVSVTHTTPAWSAKLFRVMQLTLKENDEVEVIAQEYDSTVYNLDTLTAITSTPTLSLPSPFNITNPTSLTLTSGTSDLLLGSDGTIISRIKCVFAPPSNVFTSVAEIQYKLSTDAVWQSLPLADASQGIAYIAPAKDGLIYNVRLRFVNTFGVQSAWFVAANHTVIGKIAQPGDCSVVTYTITQQGIALSWVGVSDVDLDTYELRVGASWAAGVYMGANPSAAYLWRPQLAGTYTVWVKAKDTSRNYSTNAASVSVTIAAPSAPTISYAISGVNEYLTWSIPTSAFQIDRYEIRYGSTWAGGTFVDSTKSTGYTRKADYAGARTYWVAVIDAVGNYGTPASIGVSISAPGAVTGVRADVVDNNVLIYWLAPSTGTLPFASYEVRKGTTWAGGTVVGSNGNSTFTTVFEQQSGTYTYWIAAIDSVGNYGTPASVSAFVNQPPDYILRVNINSTFSGTLVNAFLSSGMLMLPVNTTETWTQHFTNNGYATPQAQISAGNPVYINPSLASASYTEIYDYGSSLPATNIVVTLNATTISGTVTPSCLISYSNTSSAGPWTDGPVGATAVLATNFRWVKVTYSFTSTVGANLLQVNGLNIKLSTKQHTDSGAGTISNATTGLVVAFGQTFISADTPIVQPGGTVPLIPVVDFAGGVNPTGFTVYLYTLAGAKTTGTFSWSVRGY